MKSSYSTSFVGAGICACLLALTSPVHGALLASSAVVYDEGFFNGPTTVNGISSNDASPSAIGYSSSLVPGLATSGYARADYGGLYASAFSGVANPGVGATSQTRGQGSAFWSDQLTFTSPTLTGSAFAHGSFLLSGGLDSLSDPGTTANSTIAATIWINGGTVLSTSGQIVSQSGIITINDMSRGQAVNGVFAIEPVAGLTGTFSFDIPFVFGVPFQMAGSLNAFTQALSAIAGNAASAHSSFASSGLWEGISELHRADGTVLTDYSLASASGFNWLNALPSAPGSTVPLPATLWLLSAGLLASIMARRKRTA